MVEGSNEWRPCATTGWNVLFFRHVLIFRSKENHLIGELTLRPPTSKNNIQNMLFFYAVDVRIIIAVINFMH